MISNRTVACLTRPVRLTTRDCFLAPSTHTVLRPWWNASCLHGLATATAFNYDSVRPFEEIPAPRLLPLVGSLWDYIFGKGNHFSKTHELQIERCEKYGKIYRERFGSTNFVFIADPSSIETVMRAETALPRKPAIKAWIEARVGLGYQGGILSDDLEEWKRFRTPLSKLTLQPKRLQANFTQGVNEIVSDYVTYLAEARDLNPGPGQYVIPDMQSEARKLSLEAIGLVVYGKRLDLITKESRPEVTEFIKSILDVFRVFTELRMSYSFHKLLRTQAWHTNREGWRKNFEFNSVLVAELKDRLAARIEDGQPDDGEGKYYVTSLLEQLLSDPKQSLSEIILTGMDMFSSGMETISSVLTWALHFLAKNPDIQDRICDESISVLGEDRVHGTPAELQKLTLTKNTIKESLRFASVFPSNFRILDTDVDLMGYRIPANTPIGFCHYFINHSQEHFTEPEKFNPDRWLREGKNVHPFASVPFGFGARMCPGRRVSELELTVALHQICRRFRVESANTTDVKQVLNAMLVPDRPVQIRFVDRC